MNRRRPAEVVVTVDEIPTKQSCMADQKTAPGLRPPKWRPGDWMSQLPAQRTCLPLSRLAIPGSHDSLTYALDQSGPLGADLPKVARSMSHRSALARKTIVNWSQTQQMDLAKQLEAGVRYVDVRAAKRPDNGKLCAVHGLYSVQLKTAMEQAAQFVNSHPKEVLIIDFNHFYSYDEEAHQATLAMLKEVFGSKLVPRQDSLSIVSLDFCWRSGYNVLCLYQPSPGDQQSRAKVLSARHVWLWNHIRSPWANSTEPQRVVGVAEMHLVKRDAKAAAGSFVVAQLVATPKEFDVLRNLGRAASLDSAMADRMTNCAVEWLRQLHSPDDAAEENDNADLDCNKERMAVIRGLNVVIVDFVHRHEFCQTVAEMNYY